MACTEPTAEQLQLAWRQMRNRNGCPATLEAALASSAWHVPLVCLARQLGRRIGAGPGPGAAAQAAARLGTATYVPPTPAGPPPRSPQATARHPGHQHRQGVPMHRLRAATPGRDGKRAAANDLDD